MGSLIICACIFLSLHQILANKDFTLQNLSPIESSDSSSSSSSSFCSSSSSSSSDSSSSNSCDDSSYKNVLPFKVLPIPYLQEKTLYTNEDVKINRRAKIPLFHQLHLRHSSSKESSESSDSSCSLSSSSHSHSSSDSSSSSSCDDSPDHSSDSSCSSSSSPSDSSSSSSCDDWSDESSDSSCWSSSSSSSCSSSYSPSDSSSSCSSDDSSDESSDSSGWSSSSSSSCSSSSSSSDSSASCSCKDSSCTHQDKSSDSSCRSSSSSSSSCSSFSSASESSSSSSCEDSSDSSCWSSSSSSSSCSSSSSASESSSSSSCEDSSDQSSDSSCLSPSPLYLSFESNSRGSIENALDATLPPETCPPGKSLHARKDVIAMIDYIANTLSVYESINNSYNSEAIAVHDKHLNDFNQFQNWFVNRPEHLKHVLEDLSNQRLRIEPRVKKVAHVLHQYSHMEQNFNERLDKTKTLHKKLKSYKTVCKHNCNVEHLSETTTRFGQNEYICGSLEDLHRDISSELKLFRTKMREFLQEKVINDDKVYSDKINILKNNLKDVALKEFGQTMYDILNLQDEYHHFIKDINTINPTSYLKDIKQTNLHIDAKLFELEQDIEEYGKYCRSCRANVPWTLSRNAGIFFNHEESKNKNVLDDLLIQKFTDIESSINEDYANIFQELNTLLNNAVTEDVYSKELKPIQNDVIKMLQTERANLNELKNIVPESLIEKLINLSELSRKLLSNITEEVNNLQQN